MKMQDIIDEVKLELTGYLLDLEIEDSTIVSVVKKALRELERFWDETTMVTIPYASCIDLSGSDFGEKVSSIVKIYRTEGMGNAEGGSLMDPAYAQQ